MNQKAFFAKYKDPRWQKKRLEIMEKSYFACEMCYDKESTLNVHHKYYIAGNDPWDYKDEALTTLCENCHNREHQRKDDFEMFLKLMKERFSFTDFAHILSAILWEYDLNEEEFDSFVLTNYIVKGIRSGLIVKIGEIANDEQLDNAKERIING